ncbi:MAG: cation:proton antiporter, partial [Ruminococcus sp.]|nr:cation:proton antiporter [Ruminococcus sp.]
DINSYMIFGPVFFASIGLKTELGGFTKELLLFSLCFVLVALLTKIIGCGLVAKLMKYNIKDSLKVGVGMMTRGEVALIVAQKGLSVDMLDSKYFACVILLIIVSSVSTPIILKCLYKSDVTPAEQTAV